MRISFVFIVYLITDNKYQDVTPYQNEIIKWYQNIAKEYNFSNMKLLYIGNNIFQGNYRIGCDDEIKLDLEIFVDPDEDGSHPYISGSCIIGRLLTINEKDINNY